MKLIKQKNDSKETTRQKTKKNVSWLKIAVVAILAVGIAASSCYLYKSWNKAKAIAKEYTFNYNEVARLGKDHVSMEEFMLYSTDVVSSYESTYGEDIWDQTTLDSAGEKETYEESVKKEIIEEIRVVKALCKQAEKIGISISDDELTVIEENADEYYENLAQAGATENEDLTKQVVLDFYKESYLAQKVYNHYVEEYPADDGDSGASDELVSEIADIAQTYYPDLDYDLNVNWDLLDYLTFGKDTSNSTAYFVDGENVTGEEGFEN